MRIAFFSTTRAEFGILSSFINKVSKDDFFEYLLFVGGTHLNSEYGSTINEIKRSGLNITDTFDYLQEGDSSYTLALSSGYCTIEVAKLFREYEFDIICVLGDRYELIPIVLNAILFNKPIIHWGGGEVTEGVIDNQIRNMITKASQIHFVATKDYAEKIANMEEDKNRVFVTGSPVVETFREFKPIPKKELFKQLGLNIDLPVILLTYHPVSIEFDITPIQQITNLFESLKKFNFQIVVTSPNLESDRKVIMEYIQEQVRNNSNIHYFKSLGIKRYHSLIPYCSFLIGNSSSGMFEAPYFKVPTINIGDRQKGRFKHKSIIDTDYNTKSIVEGINKAMTDSFKRILINMEYEFGDGNASEKAINILKSITINQQLIRKK